MTGNWQQYEQQQYEQQQYEQQRQYEQQQYGNGMVNGWQTTFGIPPPDHGMAPHPPPFAMHAHGFNDGHPHGYAQGFSDGRPHGHAQGFNEDPEYTQSAEYRVPTAKSRMSTPRYLDDSSAAQRANGGSQRGSSQQWESQMPLRWMAACGLTRPA